MCPGSIPGGGTTRPRYRRAGHPGGAIQPPDTPNRPPTCHRSFSRAAMLPRAINACAQAATGKTRRAVAPDVRAAWRAKSMDAPLPHDRCAATAFENPVHHPVTTKGQSSVAEITASQASPTPIGTRASIARTANLLRSPEPDAVTGKLGARKSAEAPEHHGAMLRAHWPDVVLRQHPGSKVPPSQSPRGTPPPSQGLRRWCGTQIGHVNQRHVEAECGSCGERTEGRAHV